MKNENGSGTVYKLKGKRRKPWVARITTGYSMDGKQLRKVLGTFATKGEAQEYLFKYNKNPNFFNGITFEEVKNMWWEQYHKNKKEKTLKNTISALKKLSFLNNLKIAEINLMFLQKKFSEEKCDRICKNALSLIFKFAEKYDFIENNKIKFLEVATSENKIKRKIFSKKEIENLFIRFSASENEDEKEVIMCVLILIYSGMRIGELLNMNIHNVNLKDSYLTVVDSKTKAGIRNIPIHNRIINFIKLLINKNNFYLLEKNNKKITYNMFHHYFNKYIKEHTIHDTRHTFATLLNNSDANKTSIKKLIGHTNFLITENVYTHKDTEELRKAIELIN